MPSLPRKRFGRTRLPIIGAIREYFAGLEPIDRATVLIVLLLVAAIAAAFAMIVQTWTPALS